jgi:hypothetical protein
MQALIAEINQIMAAGGRLQSPDDTKFIDELEGTLQEDPKESHVRPRPFFKSRLTGQIGYRRTL